VQKARNANMQHRPVGMGIMGFQEALYMLRTPYASQAAVEFADVSMEQVCYYAYWASTELAQERGAYATFKGSLWDRGILPKDSLKLLAEERGGYLDCDTSETMDWAALRARIQQFGMRNSNCVAIAPTATISNIVGVSASIEPTYQNLFVKSNLSGEFTVINEYLVNDLKARGHRRPCGAETGTFSRRRGVDATHRHCCLCAHVYNHWRRRTRIWPGPLGPSETLAGGGPCQPLDARQTRRRRDLGHARRFRRVYRWRHAAADDAPTRRSCCARLPGPLRHAVRHGAAERP
jgi:hypothetical protein